MTDSTIREISIDELDAAVARCIFLVWEDSTRRLGLESSPEKILKEQQVFWPKREDPLLLIARDSHGDVVGYRFGHALPPEGNERIFLDQDGGVKPNCRRQGVGRALLKEQHRLARERGYSRIRTGTALELKPMIILNLQEGFDIVDLQLVKTDEWQTKCLMFEKCL
jgi:GNAT superfamily N-acetyltransferase